MPPIIAAIIGLVSNVVGGLSETQKDKIALELQENQNLVDMMKAQADIDKTEAQSPNLWISGARPAILWVCAASFAWQFLIQPIITYLFVITGHVCPVLPVFDYVQLNTILMGMLGLSGMRSWEKYQGVNGQHN